VRVVLLLLGRVLVKGVVPEVSTIVVVRFVSMFGGIVIVGTMVWIFGINESLTSVIISLEG
jgi:hypothetical protein